MHTTPLHAELTAPAPAVPTRNHAHHYRGFAGTRWRLFERTGELKPLLYTFRALLTGIHLMRGGELVAHLPTLLGEVTAPAYLPSLIEARTEAEHGGAHTVDGAVAARDVVAPHTVLDEAQAGSSLPDAASGFDALHDLVVRARLGQSVIADALWVRTRNASTRSRSGSGGSGERPAASSFSPARRVIRRSASDHGISPRCTARSSSRASPTSMTSSPVRNRSRQPASSRSRCMACFQRGAPYRRMSVSSFLRRPSA